MKKIDSFIDISVPVETDSDVPSNIRAKVDCAICSTIGFCVWIHPDHPNLCVIDIAKKLPNCYHCACALGLADLDAAPEDYDACYPFSDVN